MGVGALYFCEEGSWINFPRYVQWQKEIYRESQKENLNFLFSVKTLKIKSKTPKVFMKVQGLEAGHLSQKKKSCFWMKHCIWLKIIMNGGDKPLDSLGT